ncbi:uncharacterized protein K489DRAFT_70453 [Dissoconium aciculare CBS 342.82]|uniref:Uncharacterized protein n=1 Tax=Dissoconium aciculare CBS 342.82 TaxID=1314786 RepID=A0A6J3LYA7_9PEZI|nr:uncharacterized protein K489DRAFT_70453 [Dissoconium aciculare CBS 342.82]KAF1819602.1 hypothetical protein K489DRAFT_70453 [Dissoconium aciculare CBS 342.82]
MLCLLIRLVWYWQTRQSQRVKRRCAVHCVYVCLNTFSMVIGICPKCHLSRPVVRWWTIEDALERLGRRSGIPS